MAGNKKRRFGRAARGGRINLRKLTPRRKFRLERRRARFFEEGLDFDSRRSNNKKRALFSIVTRKGYKYRSRVLERTKRSRTLIDVHRILKQNSNN